MMNSMMGWNWSCWMIPMSLRRMMRNWNCSRPRKNWNSTQRMKNSKMIATNCCYWTMVTLYYCCWMKSSLSLRNSVMKLMNWS